MIRNLILFYFFLLPFFTIAQTDYTGVVVDKNKNYPIYGVHISVNNIPAASTDFDGYFNIKTENINASDTITLNILLIKQ